MKGFTLSQFLNPFSDSHSAAKSSLRDHFTVREFEKMAVVSEPICAYQRGRVRYQGSYWYAMVKQDICILPETQVLVVGRENATLLVKPLPLLKRSGTLEPIDNQLSRRQVFAKAEATKAEAAMEKSA